MIKTNTLPDLPDIYNETKSKKKKNKNKKDKYYIHVETSNASFLKMYKLLDMLGVENNDFFLAIYDKSLIGVDPLREDLDLETQVKVINELRRNFWYFIREVVRIPVPGGVKKYQLHRGNLAINWCCLNNINTFTELPRQNFKSISIDIFLLWIYNFGTINSTALIMNKEHKDAKENLLRIREIRDQLPEYLRFDKKYNADNKALKILQNKEDAYNHKTNNKLITKACATSVAKADNLGKSLPIYCILYNIFTFLIAGKVISYNLLNYHSNIDSGKR